MRMARKPRLLLIDAGAVFAALRYDAWEPLLAAYHVLVPSTIVRVEAIFFVDREGRRIAIDLPAQVEAGRIEEVEVSAADVAAMKRRFTPEFRERLDEGELEAIAYLVSREEDDLRFVTADGPAIQATVMVDPDSRVISLEAVLELCGFARPLPLRFSREFVKKHSEEGAVRRIQRRGMTDS